MTHLFVGPLSSFEVQASETGILLVQAEPLLKKGLQELQLLYASHLLDCLVLSCLFLNMGMLVACVEGVGSFELDWVISEFE